MCMPLLIPVAVATFVSWPGAEPPPAAPVREVSCRGLRPGMKAPQADNVDTRAGVITVVRGTRPEHELVDELLRVVFTPQSQPVSYARLDQQFGQPNARRMVGGGQFQVRYDRLELTLNLSSVVNSWTWAFPPRPGGTSDADWTSFLQQRKVSPVSYLIGNEKSQP